MKLTRNLIALLAVSAALMGGVARAQAPAAGPGDSAGLVSNAPGSEGENVTTGTPDANSIVGVEGDNASAGTAPLPNTGGAPLFMVLGGIALAGGSLLLRRKLA